mmetsp:Transcript_57342/g.134440  ORF Transcript_57342/g.134440 Transcript_57342/m.134440 type:complete len:253 (+) Transcript_57342:64-822(+)
MQIVRGGSLIIPVEWNKRLAYNKCSLTTDVWVSPREPLGSSSQRTALALGSSAKVRDTCTVRPYKSSTGNKPAPRGTRSSGRGTKRWRLTPLINSSRPPSLETNMPTRSPCCKSPAVAASLRIASVLLMLSATADFVKSSTHECGTSSATVPNACNKSGLLAVKPMPKSLKESPRSSPRSSKQTSKYGCLDVQDGSGVSPNTTRSSPLTLRTISPLFSTSTPVPFMLTSKRQATSKGTSGACSVASASSSSQ